MPKKPAVIRDGGLLSSSSVLRHCKPPGCAFGEPDDRLLWRTSTPQRLDSIFKQPSGATARASWFSWRCESIVQRRRLRASSPRGFKIRAAWNDLILRSRVSGVSKDGPATRLHSRSRRMVRASFDPRCPALLDRGRRECRMRVAPVAACAEKKHRRQQPGVHRINRHSLHNGVTAYTRSPRGPGFLAPVACGSFPQV